MIKAQYEQISSPNFEAAFQKLARLPLPVKHAYNVKRLSDALNSARRTIREEYQALIDRYPEPVVREEGKPDSHGPRTPEQEAELVKETEAFGKREIVIQREKLDWTILGDARVSAQEMYFLEAIFNEPVVIPSDEARTGVGSGGENVLPISGASA